MRIIHIVNIFSFVIIHSAYLTSSWHFITKQLNFNISKISRNCDGLKHQKHTFPFFPQCTQKLVNKTEIQFSFFICTYHVEFENLHRIVYTLYTIKFPKDTKMYIKLPRMSPVFTDDLQRTYNDDSSY